MQLEEYKKWLEENGNKEESAAYQVAERLIRWHTYNHYDYEVDLKPHVWVDTEEERLEFDLLIELTLKTETRETKRVIGVEFKETDCRKVVDQAVLRREYIDYMWIATNYCVFGAVSLLELVDSGIGWIFWDYDGFVKIIIPAKYNRENSVTELLQYLAKRAIDREIERRKEESKVRSLFEFVGGEKEW